MIKVMIVGQKYLAEQLFLLCKRKSLNIVAVSVPDLNDRLAVLAQKEKVPIVIAPKVLTAESIPDELDLILCAHAHSFVKAEARAKAKYGAVGFHPSLLPEYKGKNAIQDAIDNGETVTGGSLYILDDGWDTGPVLMQRSCQINGQGAKELWVKNLAPMALELFEAYITGLK